MSQPSNPNFLPVLLGFNISKLPNTSFFIQSANIPGVSGGAVNVATPFKNYSEPGDRLSYNELTISFIVDEALISWTSLRDWLIGLNFPNNYDQYRAIRGQKNSGIDERFSDATLQIFSSNNVLKKEVRYQRLFPVSLGDLDMKTTENQISYLPVSASFRYFDYEIVDM